MKTLKTAALGVAMISLCLGTAHAQDLLKKWGITYGGYVDAYYQYDFGRPASGDSVNGRGLDIAHQRPNIAFVELDFSRATSAKEPFGFTLDLYGGRGPEIIHLTEPGGRNKYRYVRQGYVTYAAPGKDGLTVDFGKFDTWIGYEGPDNRNQEEYSRSFNWTYSEPTYETGVRVSGKLSKALTAAVFVVQGWNEVEDGNGGKSIGGALTYAPNGDTSVTIQNHYGSEGSNTANDAGSYGGIGFPNAGNATVHLLDFIAWHNVTDKTKIGFNCDYASSAGATNGGNWNGEAFYLRRQVSPSQWAAFRIERMEDSQGLRTGAPVTFNSLTGTYDWVASKNATIRFELRHDIANRDFFDSNSGPRKDRTTATVAAIVHF